MANVTVEQLAYIIGAPVDKLLLQIQEAGLNQKKPSEEVSDEDKVALLDFLKKTHGDRTGETSVRSKENQNIRLTQKVNQVIRTSDSSGKQKIVNVQVRKKRTLVKPPAASTNKSEKKTTKKTQPSTASKNTDKITAPSKDKKAATSNKTKSKYGNTLDIPVSSPATPPSNEGKKGGRRSKKTSHGKNDRFNEQGFDNNVSGGKKSHRRKERQQEEVFARRTLKSKALEQSFTKPTAPIVREVVIPLTISVGDLAQKMAVKASDVVKFMFKLGTMVTINQVIDQDTAAIVVEEMGHKAKLLRENAVEDMLSLEKDDQNQHQLIARAPVVTVMGHVDHGKTSLLDYIRKSQVQASESGGITQHIGAYQAKTPRGTICFLDTPGHAAFTAMRARGAKVTDIVILVIAADDGVQPQTEEAIQHARAANVPLIVGITKIDKQDTDIDRIKNELSQHNVIPEDWGGDTQFVGISSHTGQGIDDLLEAIMLQAELLELKAPHQGESRGIVLESRLDKGRGPVASILVQTGLLKKGDNILVGKQFGRVRAMLNEKGQLINEAGPSMPVKILGLDGVPHSGDEMIVIKDERKSREIALFRQGKFREIKLAQQQTAKLDNIFKNMEATEKRILKVVLKADVRGSVEAITNSLERMGNDEVQVEIISGGVGGITETDTNLALASDGIIIGFNVRADSNSRRIAENEGIYLRYYSVIYDVIDDVKKVLSGMMKSELREEIVGIAEVRDVFRSPKFGAIAGCMVIEGHVYRNERIRVLRDDIVIFEGELESLRRFKDDVNEVKQGMECGIGVKNYNDVKIGDKIETYKTIEIARNL